MLSPSAALLDELVQHGHLLPSGEPGVFGCGSEWNAVHRAIDTLLERLAASDGTERLRFPPVVPRRLLDEVGYTGGFPHLTGVVAQFGDPAEQQRSVRAGAETVATTPTRLALLPAACYPAYPAIAARGALPQGGVTLDLGAACVFRNEPSHELTRWQTFHQREFVRIADERSVLAWRELWMRRAASVFAALGLATTVAPANDPFFGRTGTLIARAQREERLKYEASVSLSETGGDPVAVASFNYHRGHLADTFGIAFGNGAGAHTACVGFGVERILIALCARHGCAIEEWPVAVRRALSRHADD